MPFFRRKSEKAKPPTQLSVGQGVRRTPSNASSLSSSSLSHTPEDLGINGDIDSPSSVFSQPGSGRPCTLLLEPDEAEDSGDLGQRPATPLQRSSRLSKTLQEILQDKNALQYFIGFMESQGSGSLIRFWLDASSFQASTLTRLRSYALQLTSHSARSSSTSSGGGLSQDRTPNPAASEEDAERGLRTTEVLDRGDSAGGASRVDTLEASHTGSTSASPDARSQEQTTLSGHLDREGHPFPQRENCKGGNSGTANSQALEERVPDSGDGRGAQTASPNLPESPQTEVPACDSDGSEFGPMQSAPSQELSTDNSAPQEGRELSQGDVQETSGVFEEKPTESVSAQTKGKRSFSREDLAKRLNDSIERDAVNIFTKYLSQDATHPIGIPDELRNDAIKRICPPSGQVDPKCFEACQTYTVHSMQERYHQAFLDSEYHCKHQVDVLTSGVMFLEDLLYNEVALSYFMEYVEQEGGSHLLQFWIAADNFQHHLASMGNVYDGMEAQNDAMVLYDKYFSLQASHPLGFDDKTRFEVEGNICREGGPLPDCFSRPRDIVLKTIKKNHFHTYMQSDMYYKFLSDLISMVQTANIAAPKHRRTGSDASSEHSGGSQSVGADSISAKNTLLAAGIHHKKRAAHKIGDDLRLDSGMLNPDELWKRPNAGKMSFGKVNSLGQFESEVLPQPDEKKKGGSIFFKRKADKEKEQEEMALRVAQLILQDVETMTQTGAAYASPASSTTAPTELPDSSSCSAIAPVPSLQ